jgi:hypothetical protein
VPDRRWPAHRRAGRPVRTAVRGSRCALPVRYRRLSNLIVHRGTDDPLGINAPKNILYLLAASVMAEHGLSPNDVHFVTDVPLPAIRSTPTQ